MFWVILDVAAHWIERPSNADRIDCTFTKGCMRWSTWKVIRIQVMRIWHVDSIKFLWVEAGIRHGIEETAWVETYLRTLIKDLQKIVFLMPLPCVARNDSCKWELVWSAASPVCDRTISSRLSIYSMPVLNSVGGVRNVPEKWGCHKVQCAYCCRTHTCTPDQTPNSLCK